MLADQFRFVFFQRTGVRLLLGNAHRGQHVKNLLALDFQLTGQIIDSNLHPLSFSFSGPARLYARILTLAYLTSRNPCPISLWRGWRSPRFRSGHTVQTRRIPSFSSACLPGLLLARLLRSRLLRSQAALSSAFFGWSPFRQARLPRSMSPLPLEPSRSATSSAQTARFGGGSPAFRFGGATASPPSRLAK